MGAIQKDTPYTGTFRSNGWIKGMSWDTVPRPVHVGNTNVQALIITNVYDPLTPFKNAGLVKNHFPSSHIMSWQGGWHMMKGGILEGKLYPKSPSLQESAKYDELCFGVVSTYLETGRLPQDSYICA